MAEPLSKRHAAAYAQRMNRVLDHIDRRLDENLQLAELAEVANFSPFHFHRVFSAWMGETLGDYLRRRRLDTAATRLAHEPQVSVLEVALGVGFGSGEAFARAFRQRFGAAPTVWRAEAPRRWREGYAQRRGAQRKPGQVDRNPDQACADGTHDDGLPDLMEFPMDVTLVTLPPTRIAYLRNVGPYGPGIHQFWQEAFHPWLRAADLLGRTMYGIGRDDPMITAPDKCRYDACVEVPEGYAARAPAQLDTLPGGRYATAPFFGTSDEIGAAYGALLGEWIPSSGLQVDARPIYEHYPVGARYDIERGVFECNICVPVRPA